MTIVAVPYNDKTRKLDRAEIHWIYVVSHGRAPNLLCYESLNKILFYVHLHTTRAYCFCLREFASEVWRGKIAWKILLRKKLLTKVCLGKITSGKFLFCLGTFYIFFSWEYCLGEFCCLGQNLRNPVCCNFCETEYSSIFIIAALFIFCTRILQTEQTAIRKRWE